MSSSAREKVLNTFKSILFPIKDLDTFPTHEPTPEVTTDAAAEPTTKIAIEPTEATPTKHKKCKLKLQQEFMNEIIADEK